MLDFLKWREGDTGKAPGTLEYRGRKRDFPAHLVHYAYSQDGLNETCLRTDADKPELTPGKTHFLSLVGIHDSDVVATVGSWFDIHPLILEDILSPGLRPKVNEVDEGIFMALRNVAYDPETNGLKEEQVCILWTPDCLIAFQETDEDAWEPVVDRLRKGKGRIRAAGTHYLCIALLDALVDRAMDALAALSAEVEEHETGLAGAHGERQILELYRVRRDVTFLMRNVLMPTTEILATLRDEETFPMPGTVRPFLDDVSEHAVHASESAKVLHDILASMMDVHISLAGMRMNNVMKVLTVVATIFIPLTFITGIYGMNFEYMPELHWPWAYPAALILMGAIAIAMAIYFARKRWF